jgi:hypothetical protein
MTYMLMLCTPEETRQGLQPRSCGLLSLPHRRKSFSIHRRTTRGQYRIHLTVNVKAALYSAIFFSILRAVFICRAHRIYFCELQLF